LRTIVCSDIHGNLARLRAILDHSKFDLEKDRLIHAGDCCDIGPFTYEVMDLLERNGAKFLIGNHELAHLLPDQHIRPYDATLDFSGDFCSRWNRMVVEKTATFFEVVEDITISHAGIPNQTLEKYQGSIEALEDEMYDLYMKKYSFNELLFSEIDSPVWYRPYSWYIGVQYVPAPIPQMCGHTPYHSLPYEALTDPNLYCIDGYSANGSVIYGIIEDGKASTVLFIPEIKIPEYRFR
jgi:hypothetical protein